MRHIIARFPRSSRRCGSILEPVYARHTSNAIAKRVIASHKAVIESIEAGDAERACALMRRRLQTIRATKMIDPPIRITRSH